MKFRQNDDILVSVFIKLWWRPDMEILSVFNGPFERGIFSYILIIFSKLGYHHLIMTNVSPNQYLIRNKYSLYRAYSSRTQRLTLEDWNGPLYILLTRN